jgi:hypothetical protein
LWYNDVCVDLEPLQSGFSAARARAPMAVLQHGIFSQFRLDSEPLRFEK